MNNKVKAFYANKIEQEFKQNNLTSELDKLLYTANMGICFVEKEELFFFSASGWRKCSIDKKGKHIVNIDKKPVFGFYTNLGVQLKIEQSKHVFSHVFEYNGHDAIIYDLQ